MGFNKSKQAGGASAGTGFDPDTISILQDDFLTSAALMTSYSNSGTGSAAVITSTALDSDHPGIIRQETGTTTSGRSTGYFGNLMAYGNAFQYDFIFRLEDLSDGTNTYHAVFGILNDVGALSGLTDGIFLKADSNANANFQFITRASSTDTTTDTGVAIAADTWYNCSIIANSDNTSITCYINGTLVATNTANIPSTNGYFQMKIEKTAGTTERVMYCDYHGINLTVSR